MMSNYQGPHNDQIIPGIHLCFAFSDDNTAKYFRHVTVFRPMNDMTVLQPKNYYYS